ncbi:MAG: glycine--tRNA ligase subunit beta [Woeseiaceae bacterium]
MTKTDDFLIEVGTEELPPKALRALMDAFGAGLTNAIDDAKLKHGAVHAYASPRRLAVVVDALAHQQADRKVLQKGPPTRIAFDKEGKPTAAATSFAEKCGVDVTELGTNKTDKGEWLIFEALEKGKTAVELMPALVEQSLGALPVPRRMRWGDGDAEFVRPVHWVVMLHGQNVIDAPVIGTVAGDASRGHRFHSSGPVVIAAPKEYLETLEHEGRVIADFARRRELVRDGVTAAATAAGGLVVDGESLYDEVAALVEWPVAVLGHFGEEFLTLPREVVVSTLAGHQRYFPVADQDGALLPRFITVANLESKEPEKVREGNERVIRPRLADAAFFWDNDRRRTLDSRRDALSDVVYQRGLGSLDNKTRRVKKIAAWLASKLGADRSDVERAAELAKCDLLSGMVGEFPELQGTMGRYYALSDREPDAVAEAIGEHYRPRFAGDDLPVTKAGRILAIADKLDTIAGVFSVGKKPTGNRDPFGLRRSSLGVIRILIECGLDIDLTALISKAVEQQPKSKIDNETLVTDLYTFISDRLRRYFLDRDAGLAPETFEAVMVRRPKSLLDFDRRLAAVQTFARMEQAESLAAANKRIANILRQAGEPRGLKIQKKLFAEEAEQALFNALDNARNKVEPLIEQRQYAEALSVLADLRDPVDRFFDDVMVMADDEAVKNNRLALLSDLRSLFLDVADISRLSLG